jgi:hypothetical protein
MNYFANMRLNGWQSHLKHAGRLWKNTVSITPTLLKEPVNDGTAHCFFKQPPNLS